MVRKVSCLVIALMMFSGVGIVHGTEQNVVEESIEATEPTDPPSTMEPTVEAEETKPTVAPTKPTESATQPSSSQPTTKTVKKDVKVGEVSGLTVKHTTAKTTTLSWKKASKAQRYEIYRYSNKSKKYVKCRTTNKTSVKIKKLKSDTKYRFKVRGYRVNDGKTKYGKFSRVKKVKTKINKQAYRNRIVKKGKSRIGCSYVSGRQGPTKFDCSGFVYWTYKNANVKPKKAIKRQSANSMYGSLKKYKVSSKLSGAKKGDIIFYKNGGRYTHVAISIGNGKIVHAANPKKGVCVAKASACRSSSVAVIRLI